MRQQILDQIDYQLSTLVNSKSKTDISRIENECNTSGCCLQTVGKLSITKEMVLQHLNSEDIEFIEVPGISIPVRKCVARSPGCFTNTKDFRSAVTADLGIVGCCSPSGFDEVSILVKIKNIPQIKKVALQTSPNSCQCLS